MRRKFSGITALNGRSMLPTCKHRAQSDAGLTLVELLVVLVITPLVLGATAVGLISMFATEHQVGAMVDSASKAQIAAAQLSTDLKAASAATQNRTPSCGPSTMNGIAVIQKVALMSEDGSTVVAYVNATDGKGTWSMLRVVCSGLDTTTPVSTTTVSTSPTPLDANLACNALAETCPKYSDWIPSTGIGNISVHVSPTSNIVAAPQTWTTQTTTTTTTTTTLAIVPTPPVTSVPTKPTSVGAAAGDARASVNWTASVANSDTPVISYNVKSSPGNFTCTTVPPMTACDVSGLTNGTSYTFAVTATNSVGASSPSDPSNSVIPSSTPPPVVTPTPATVETPLILMSTTCPVAEFADRSTLSVGGGSGIMAINAECSPAVNFTGGVFRGRGWKAHKKSKTVVGGTTPLVNLNTIQELGTFSDPFANFSAPSVTASGLGSCVSGVCSPGVYTSLAAMNSGSFTFLPGDYVFNTPVIIGGTKKNKAASVHFGAGNYNFAQGFIESGYATVSFASGTAKFSGTAGVCNAPVKTWDWKHSKDDDDFWTHFNEKSTNCSRGPKSDEPLDSTKISTQHPALSVFGHATLTSGDSNGGMLLYVASGGLSLQTSGNKGIGVNLTGNSKFGGIAIWDDATASSGQALLGTHTPGNTTNFGGVYIPNQTAVIGQGGVLNTSFMVLDSLKMLGNGTLNVG